MAMDANPLYLKGITSTTTYGQMRRQADNLDVTIASAHLPGNMEGCYDQHSNIILIDRSMTYTQKRCALLHELIHWAHKDTSKDGVYGSRIEHRTRRETALKLIDPIEYQTAEAMYEGDAYQIACELDVTLQVVQDYQRMLDSNATTSTRLTETSIA